MILCLAPDLCSGDEADLVVEAGQVLAEGAVVNRIHDDGLRVRVGYDLTDLQDDNGRYDFNPAQREAMEIFQLCLGALRTWRPDFGTLREEARRANGYGSFVEEETGARVLGIGPAIDYSGSDHGGRAELLQQISATAHPGTILHNALVLNGRTARSAADYYMIFEYAVMEFGQPSKIAKLLGIYEIDLTALRDSSCNISPFEGGRHAEMKTPSKITLDLAGIQRTAAQLLRAWITYADNHSSGASGRPDQ